MNIAIYQINPDRDENRVAFLNYEKLERFQGSAALRSEIYDKVFEGEVDCSTPYFDSLNKEQLERYKKQFQNPERFFRVGGEIKAVPYKPEKDHER